MKGQTLYQHAKTLIPGGTQLLSKRPEQFLPDGWPTYYSKASGIDVTDLDGNVYTDMSIMAVGACVLGYADPDVDAAVQAAIEGGSQCTLNAPEEVELAEVLCELHPWASMVRYARGGGEAMSMAVRIARAHTGRDRIAFCGYHGWTDWYLAANLGLGDALDGQLMSGLEPAGVPDGLAGTALPFHYNHIEELRAIVDSNQGQLAAIVMEPQRSQPPADGFLEEVRELASGTGAVLVFDEVSSGFRMTAGGIHLLLGVEPDIAVFAKAMANGYAMAAVIGRERVMQAAQSTFISSTNWTERIGPAAALATIEKYRRCNVAEHIKSIGAMATGGWERAAANVGLDLSVSGLPSACHFQLHYEDALAMNTLFTQLMLAEGYLAWHLLNPSFAHRAQDVDAYLVKAEAALAVVKEASDSGDVRKRLVGPACRPGFYRLT